MSRAFGVADVNAIEQDGVGADYYLGLQRAINGGLWSLQGSYGRSMMGAIESGMCMLGTERARDYWGNFIPARTDVQEGTKGSAGFVRERMGDEWLAKLEAA